MDENTNEPEPQGIRALVASAIQDPELRAAFLQCKTDEDVQALIATLPQENNP